MKDYLQTNKKGIILVLIGLLFAGLLFIKSNKVEDFSKRMKRLSYVAKEVEEPNVIMSVDETKDIVLNEYFDEIDFYAKTFQIDGNVLYNKLKENYDNLGLGNEGVNIDLVLINYLFALENGEPALFNKKTISQVKTKDYMLSLINYFSHVYGNVDFAIAAGIAQIESGYTAPFMLSKNNIFGGMSGSGLIGYRNIEYGILSYIRLLSESYFSQGLNSVERIGYIYNPIVNAHGAKTANPTWVANVKRAVGDYQNYPAITDLTGLVSVN